MTPEREKYLAKCSKREKLLRFKIKEYKIDIQNEKYRLTQGACLIEPDNTKAKGRIKMYKYHLAAYRHELARLKRGRGVKPISYDAYVEISYAIVGVCPECGDYLFGDGVSNYCSNCGRRILWKKVK